MVVKVGNSGANTLNGTIFADLLKGLGGADTLNGEAGTDTLIGGTGADRVFGGRGRDFLEVGDGDTASGEIYDGGDTADTDTLLISDTAAPVVGDIEVDFSASQIVSIEVLDFNGDADIFATFSAASFGGSGFVNALGVNGSDGSDTITINMNGDTGLNLSGWTFGAWSISDDIFINGGAAGEAITGTSQRDVISSGLGVDSINAGIGDDVIVADGTLAGESYNGGNNAFDFDVLLSTVESVDLRGATLIDIEGIEFNGAGGFDEQVVFVLADQIGGSGIAADVQLTSFSAANSILDVTMGTETTFNADNFEFAFFAAGDFVRFSGDGDAETMIGSEFTDVMLGRAGNDILLSGQGSDTLNGGVGADSMFGASGDDLYFVDNVGDIAAEILIGADPGGVDEVRASVSHTLTSFIENLTLAGNGQIDGTGNALANRITGNAAANELKGLGGADRLEGGEGADRFVFTALNDSGSGAANRDVIIDFIKGQDKIDIGVIDANATIANVQNFVLDTDGSVEAGKFQLRVAGGNTVIEFNSDGDAAFEMQILVEGVTNLAIGDFIL